MCVKMKINANVCLCALFVAVPYCLEEISEKESYRNVDGADGGGLDVRRVKK